MQGSMSQIFNSCLSSNFIKFILKIKGDVLAHKIKLKNHFLIYNFTIQHHFNMYLI